MDEKKKMNKGEAGMECALEAPHRTSALILG